LECSVHNAKTSDKAYKDDWYVDVKPASRAIADTILQHVSEAVSSVAAVTSLGEGCSDIADLSLSQKIVQSLQKITAGK